MNQNIIDKAKPVREKEQLPLDKVDVWIKANIPNVTGTPEITQYTGGASNWTYRIKYDSHDLILRRPPAGTKAASAHDMKREYEIQKALMPYYTVPEMLAFCSDHSVMECDFYIMRRVEGIIPRANLPKDLTLSKEEVRQLCLNVIDKLIEKENTEKHPLTDEESNKLKQAFEKALNNANMKVEVESLPADALPVTVTMEEWMRRMKDMSRMGGGMNFYGNMPDTYKVAINANHPVMAKILAADEAQQYMMTKQLTDLALLATGLLKGADLTAFVERSVGAMQQ